MKKRNLKYENKFRSYLFSGCFERHKEICKNINVKPNINKIKLTKKEKELFDEIIETYVGLCSEETLKKQSIIIDSFYNKIKER